MGDPSPLAPPMIQLCIGWGCQEQGAVDEDGEKLMEVGVEDRHFSGTFSPRATIPFLWFQWDSL